MTVKPPKKLILFLLFLLFASGFIIWKTNNFIVNPVKNSSESSNPAFAKSSGIFIEANRKYFASDEVKSENYQRSFDENKSSEQIVRETIFDALFKKKSAPKIKPSEIKAIYVTAPAAFIPSWMDNLISLATSTEINAMVINVKDGSDIYLTDKMADLVKKLNDRNIYTIARIVVFQDNKLADEKPELALKNPEGKIWEDKGYKWVDPSSKEVWDYNKDIALKAAAMGFDELNFDYFRFPSDGKISKIIYPAYDGAAPKIEIINDFARFLIGGIKEKYPARIVSLDIFGYTFVTEKDLGIGQRLSDLANYFDVIAPMVYPSHFSKGNFGYKNPAGYPYEVVFESLRKGEGILNKNAKKPLIRPWLQDFDLGAVYTPKMVREQIKAVYDSGNKSGWMIWNPKVNYNRDNFLPK